MRRIRRPRPNRLPRTTRNRHSAQEQPSKNRPFHAQNSPYPPWPKAKVNTPPAQPPKEHAPDPLKPGLFPPSIKETAGPTDKMLILN
jgi:hypothetical protein